MGKIIKKPSIVEAAGNMPKRIEEFVGRVNTSDEDLSIARMKSPKGWTEPGQKPEFDEYTLVLNGKLQVETKDGMFEILAGQAYIAVKDQWVRYSSPEADTEYISVCTPAFSPDTVHRDKE